MEALARRIESRDCDKLVILSNDYHLPRLDALIERDDALNKLKQSGKLSLRSAESVLIAHDAKWKKKIEVVYATDEMKRRVALEKQGARQIREGSYQYKK